MSDKYRFNISTSQGKVRQVYIPNPDRTVENSIIKDAATKIINSNVFKTKNGSLKVLKNVEFIRVTRQSML